MKNRLLSEFVQLSCAPDVLRLKLFPNAKEITESMAMYSAVRKYVCDDFRNDKIAMVSVGDGASPRTAGLFAFRSAWNCYSIDPNLKDCNKWELQIKRLHCCETTVEEFPGIMRPYDKLIVVMVHSHAPIEATVAKFPDALAYLSMPCCVPHSLHHRPYIGIEDDDITSPKNTIKIWAKNLTFKQNLQETVVDE